MDILNQDERILKDPAPIVAVDNLGDQRRERADPSVGQMRGLLGSEMECAGSCS